jgi:hypothetical protein
VERASAAIVISSICHSSLFSSIVKSATVSRFSAFGGLMTARITAGKALRNASSLAASARRRAPMVPLTIGTMTAVTSVPTVPIAAPQIAASPLSMALSVAERA